MSKQKPTPPAIDPEAGFSMSDTIPRFEEEGAAKLSDMIDVASRPAPVPAKVELGECIGKMIECPTCGKPALVQNARGARTQTQVLSSKWWVMVKCGGYCGSCLHRVALLVTPLPQPIPEPVIKELGACVGKSVKCPKAFLRNMGTALERTELCNEKAQAAWDIDLGHTVKCPQCGVEAYEGSTLVEVVG
jgi:hypothetical protein